MSLSLLLKLLILPVYLMLPFTLDLASGSWPWHLPFLVWGVLILINGLAEYLRSRR